MQTNAFGDDPFAEVPEPIRSEIHKVAREVQVPFPTAVAAVLSAAAIAVQGSTEVMLPPGFTVPTALYFLLFAGSGDRKTAAEREPFKPIFELEKQWEDEYILAINSFELAFETWVHEKSMLKKKRGKSEQQDSGVHQAHLKTEPLAPRRRQLLLKDVSPEGIAWWLYQNGSAGLVVNEGGLVLNGHAGGNIPMLNALWDLCVYPVVRRESESFTLRECPLTISLGVHHGEFAKFINGRGKHARSNGFLARCLISNPASLQGYRTITTYEYAEPSGASAFQERLRELLKNAHSAQSPSRTRRSLRLSTDACVMWVNFANEIETLQQSGQRFFNVRDMASKLADNAARIAGVMHGFCYEESEIGPTTMLAAIKMARYYADQFCLLFDPQNTYPQYLCDAYTLDSWLRKQWQQVGRTQYTMSNLMQLAPSEIRGKLRMHPAVMELTRIGILLMNQIPSSNGKQPLVTYVLSPNTYPLVPPPTTVNFG